MTASGDPAPSSDTDADPPESSDGPQIVNLGSSVSAIGEGDFVLISAIVTDPDGVGDVIGGVLETPDGESVFGTFATGADEGAYQLQLTFDDVATVSGTVGITPRTVEMVARFFDQASNETQQTITVGLECGSGMLCVDKTCMVEPEGGNDFGVGECYPFNPSACPEGEMCAPQEGLFRCQPAGNRGQGEACETAAECAGGLLCSFGLFGAESQCLTWCDLSAPDCPTGTTCREVPFFALCGNEGLCE